MAETPASRARHRILVTGSRGKSSVVRLLSAALSSLGLHVRARVTGVRSRELSPSGERLIVRNSPAHVGEMRWWLRQLPADTEAVVMENSAVSPDLQHLAAMWLDPTLAVLTNVRNDHQEVWGSVAGAAAHTLVGGIPVHVPLIIGAEVADCLYLRPLLASRDGSVATAAAAPGNYRAANMSIAGAALGYLGLMEAGCEAAMRSLPPDIGDFRVFMPEKDTTLAAAFSANDLASTELLFSMLAWREEETCLYFSDRADRPLRRASFEPFFRLPWRRMLISDGSEHVHEVRAWLRGKRVFGCGNVAGTPLKLIMRMIAEGCPWTIPGA